MKELNWREHENYFKKGLCQPSCTMLMGRTHFSTLNVSFYVEGGPLVYTPFFLHLLTYLGKTLYPFENVPAG